MNKNKYCGCLVTILKAPNVPQIKGVHLICSKCGKPIRQIKIRKRWKMDPNTRIVPNKKIYDRSKDKRETSKEIEEINE